MIWKLIWNVRVILLLWQVQNIKRAALKIYNVDHTELDWALEQLDWCDNQTEKINALVERLKADGVL